MSGNFKYTRWDPILISSQIVAIQSTFYVTLGFVLFVFSHLFGYLPNLDQIFNYQILSFKTGLGLLITFSFLLNSLLGALILYFLVQRAKKCLDFSVTVFATHLLGVWIYNGQFPWSFSWWILTVICLTTMCVAGEYLCLKTELKAIPLLVTHKASAL